jgi:hypothetical protein
MEQNFRSLKTKNRSPKINFRSPKKNFSPERNFVATAKKFWFSKQVVTKMLMPSKLKAESPSLETNVIKLSRKIYQRVKALA